MDYVTLILVLKRVTTPGLNGGFRVGTVRKGTRSTRLCLRDKIKNFPLCGKREIWKQRDLEAGRSGSEKRT